MILRNFLFVVIALILVVGCSSSDTVEEQDIGIEDAPPSDLSNSDIKGDIFISDVASDTTADILEDVASKECLNDKDCSGTKKKCLLSKNICVECVYNSDCPVDYSCDKNQCTFSTASCNTDGECEKGKICESNKCQTGCRSIRDCPEKMFCDTSIEPFGECVQCLKQEDCQENYNCVNGQCIFYCTSDKECNGQYCNLTTHKCVDCLQDGNCPIKTICDSTNKCVEGCRSSRDCTPLLCDTNKGDNGKCVECLKNEDCGDQNKVCNDGICEFRCSKDEDCYGQRCDTNSGICVECLLKSDCNLGFICIGEKCVSGCEDQRDCPPSQSICKPELGQNGACVACDKDEDCQSSEKCVQNNCLKVCKTDNDCIAGYCDSVSGKCVECLKSDQCMINMICENMKCIPGCSKDKPCYGNYKCDLSVTPGRCVECMSNNDCLPNGECLNNTCKYPGKQCGESCQDTSECATGLKCGILLQQCLIACQDNNGCYNGDCLNLGNGGVCLTCAPAKCDPECKNDEECIDGKCVKKCFPPCDFGYTCNNGYCETLASECNPTCQKDYFCYNASCRKYEYGSCPAGMLYISETKSCIDQFEASKKSGEIGSDDGTGTTAIVQSVNGVKPLVNVTYYQAKKMCENSGKRLCKSDEFFAACDGISNYIYPYGNTYIANACNTNSSATSAAPTGNYIKCVSYYGVVDMSGNVWEWTDTTYSVTGRAILGGSYASSPENTTCKSDLNAINNQTLPLTEKRDTLGFRCCK